MTYQRANERVGTRFVFKTTLSSLVYTFLFIYILIFISPVFGFGSFVVASDSMLPTLNKGDMIVLKRTSSIQVGDIITFTQPLLGTVTHRLVAVVEDDGQTYYVCCGDNNLNSSWQELVEELKACSAEEVFAIADDIVNPKDVIGVVKLKFNKIGYAINYLQNNKLIIFIFALLIIYIIKQDDKIVLEKYLYNYFT